MIEMQNWATKAVAKLEEGRKAIPAFNADEVTKKLRDSKIPQNQKDQIMLAAKVSIVADSAYEALCSFCRQSEAFAQNVAQGGSLSECVQSVMGGTVYAISDLDVYRKCAAYYFPSAKIGMALTIDTANVKEAEGKNGSGNILSLKLDDFLR